MYAANRNVDILRIVDISTSGNQRGSLARPGDGIEDRNRALTRGNNNNVEKNNNVETTFCDDNA